LTLPAFCNRKAGKVKSVYRVFFFAPQVTSSIAVAAIWLWLLNPEISPLNTFLARIGLPTPDWLQDPRTAIPAIALVSVWQARLAKQETRRALGESRRATSKHGFAPARNDAPFECSRA